jgi:subtilisin family serine protease
MNNRYEKDPKIKKMDKSSMPSQTSDIEIEFKEEVRPEIITPSDSHQEIKSSTNIKLDDLNQILRKYNLQKSESTFEISAEEAHEAQSTAKSVGTEVPNLKNFVTLHFPPNSDAKQIAQELDKLPEVLRAVPIPKAAPPSLVFDEPLIGESDQVVKNPTMGLENQWYIFRCGANNAWKISSGKNVVIADIDWGYRVSHQDLSPNLDLTHAYNSYDGGNNVSYGDTSHGTAVMGITGAAANSTGMRGFACGATLWPIQADSGPGTPLGGNEWARAIEWVRTSNSEGKRKVIILEVQTSPALGNYEQIPSVNAAIRLAIASGVIVCVAAGNGDRDAGIDDSDVPFSPTGSILVGATEYDPIQNKRAWFSNYGSQIVVCAPGDGDHDITCDIAADDSYRNEFGGTSGATPKVAGTVAMMLEANPKLTHAKIRSILRDTGTKVFTDSSKPVGTFLNSHGAVEAARSTVSS